MRISRELALKIIKYLLENPSFYFPFHVMCQGYASHNDNNEEFVEIVPHDDYENLIESSEYNTFELWENLQNLQVDTIKLMSKGFIEKILEKDIVEEISNLANHYRNKWKVKLWESTNIEEFGHNEFLGGKTEGFEESLEIVKKYLS